MAIQKEKTLASGVTGNYWRILDIYLDRTNFKAVGRLGLFKYAAASAAGQPHIPGTEKAFKFTFSFSEIAEAPNLITYAYGKIITIADQEIAFDVSGEPIDPPRKFDPDISGGVNV